jgi:chromosome segregation ATPase
MLIRKMVMKEIKNRIMITPLSGKSVVNPMILIFLLLLSSCASVNISSDGNVNEQLKAENRIMKNNLTLAVRENSVLKDENIQYKDNNNKLKTRVRLLESEIESLNKKHQQDIALLAEKYENLSRKNFILEQESSTKIQELTTVNKALEEKLSAEIALLNENMRKQDEKFNKERAAFETAFSSKELQYQKELAQLKKDLLNSSIEMESLKTKLAESGSILEAARTELLKRERINRDLEKKIETLATENRQIKEDSPELKKGTD